MRKSIFVIMLLVSTCFLRPASIFDTKTYTSRRVKADSVITQAIFRIYRAIKGNLAELRQAISNLNRAEQTQDEKMIKLAQEELKKLLNQINSFKGKIDNLELGEINILDEFKNSEFYQLYREKVAKLVLNGGYVAEMFFAGAATRLYKSIEERLGKDKAQKLAKAMYFIDAWQLAKELGYQLPADAIKGLGIGPRQLLQLNLSLRKIAEEFGYNPDEVIARQKIVLHINLDIAEEVEKDLAEHNYYGFSPQNFYILLQPSLSGFAFDEKGKLFLEPSSKRFPYGHGYATEQLRGVLDELILNGAKLMGTYRISDLQRLTFMSLDVNRLALALFLMEDKGANIVAELLDDPKDRRNGIFLRDKNSGAQFLLEGLHLRTEAIQQRLDQIYIRARQKGFSGIPYGAFRMVYKIDRLPEILKNDLWDTIRIRDKNYIYLELVTGDITLLPGAKTEAFIAKDKNSKFLVAKSFRSLAELPQVLKILLQQDTSSLFVELVERYYKQQ